MHTSKWMRSSASHFSGNLSLKIAHTFIELLLQYCAVCEILTDSIYSAVGVHYNWLLAVAFPALLASTARRTFHQASFQSTDIAMQQ